MQGQTASVLTALESQGSQVKEAIEGMEKVLKDLAKADKDREDDVKNLKEDLEAVKDLIPKMVEKSKEDQKYALGELQSELKSLRGLLVNRGASSSSLPAAPTPSYSVGRPSIPSWQLQTTPSSSSSSTQQQQVAKEDDKEKEKEKETTKEKAASEGQEETPKVEGVDK